MSRWFALLLFTIAAAHHATGKNPNNPCLDPEGVAEACWSPSCNPWSPPVCADCADYCADCCADEMEECPQFLVYGCASRCAELWVECCQSAPECEMTQAEMVEALRQRIDRR